MKERPPVDRLTIVVPDPPPMRAHPGRSANRNSPNAEPLARAGEALVASDPRVFPFDFAGVIVVFGRTMPDVDPLGYQPEHPIMEVLATVGAVEDHGRWWSRTSQDTSADFYVVTFVTSEAEDDSGLG